MAVNLVIATNMAALNANRNLSVVGKKRDKISKKLSSGNRLYSATEDAASLSISSKMKAQIIGFEASKKNTEDTINMLKVGEGALTEVNSIFQRCRELSIQAATDTLTTSDRQKIANEMIESLNAADGILKNAEFNGSKIFVEGFGDVFQTGSNTGDILLIDSDVFLTNLNSMMQGTNDSLYENVVNIFNNTLVTTMEQIANKNIKQISDQCIIGGKDTRLFDYKNLLDPLFTAIDSLDTFGSDTVEKMKQDLKKDIEDLVNDFRQQSLNNVNELIAGRNLNELMNITISKTDTIGNVFKIEDSAVKPQDPSKPRVRLKQLLEVVQDKDRLVIATKANGDHKAFPNALQAIFDKHKDAFLDESNYKANLKNELKLFINGQGEISPERFSETYLPKFDELIDTISDKQIAIGSGINRLEHTISSTQVTKENLYASNSRIQDADMVGEMVNYTLDSARVEYATLLLSQSNSDKNNVLRLLE